jgi:mitochondrial fission protein ELM1
MESQCVGLAEAMGLVPVIKRVRQRTPWHELTPYVRFGGRVQFTSASDELEPPWPDLLIATGRHSVAASLLVRKLSEGHSFTVQLQNPVIALSHFDLVVVPRHDNLSGPNVIATRGALNRVTPALIKESAERIGWRFAHLKGPFIAVLVGGSNATYRLGPEEMHALAERLAVCAADMKASLLITPSRRTGKDNLAILKSSLIGLPHYLWENQGENPYFGFLGMADFIVATSDSINMVSEAASTGKPVYIAHLPGGSAKFHRFHHALNAEGVTRIFKEPLEPYTYQPLDDVAMVAESVRALLRG